MNLYYGIVCFGISIFIFFISSRERNVLGYKSPQLNTHKKIWLWTNKCFGFLTFIGSVIYLLLSLIFYKDVKYLADLTKYGMFYIVFSIVATELYAYMKKIKDKKNRQLQN